VRVLPADTPPAGPTATWPERERERKAWASADDQLTSRPVSDSAMTRLNFVMIHLLRINGLLRRG
jgi:hypothetical protein